MSTQVYNTNVMLLVNFQVHVPTELVPRFNIQMCRHWNRLPALFQVFFNASFVSCSISWPIFWFWIFNSGKVVCTGSNAVARVFSSWARLYPLISKYKAKKPDAYAFDDIDELSTVDNLLHEQLVNTGMLDMKKILPQEDAKQDIDAKKAWSGGDFVSIDLNVFEFEKKNNKSLYCKETVCKNFIQMFHIENFHI